ncbi:hypothetical protein NC651_003878 [Populus alba x Populus x berolinensis]|nr:hypothetical protein NC651_003878 [Populus alba x Populus x berolinensis]
MQMPAIFTDPQSSLYDPLRDANHQPPTLLDLNYNKCAANPDPAKAEELYASNLNVMYRQMVHTQIHYWTGDPNQTNGENMGNFYSAGREFLFWDENKELVRVKVKDTLDTKKLRYGFQDVPILWLTTRPTPKLTREEKSRRAVHSLLSWIKS